MAKRYQSIYDYWLLPLWYLLAIVLSVLLLFMTTDYFPFDIFWPLCYLYFFYLWLLITSPLISFGHCVICTSSIYDYWLLPLWYLLAIVLSVLLLFMTTDYFPFDIFWPLCCLSFFYLWLLITEVISSHKEKKKRQHNGQKISKGK
jgi:uncharacterized membrane protein HdeD (DUF308 family)